MGENGFPAHDLRATKSRRVWVIKGESSVMPAPKTPGSKNGFIRFMEWVVGRPFLYRIYCKLNDIEATPQNVWGNAWARCSISRSTLIKRNWTKSLQVVQRSSWPTIPLVLQMEVCLGTLVTRKRDDYFILVNEIISRVPLLKGHMLPVEFSQTEEGKKINQNTKDQTTKRLNDGECLIIFPGGGVATRSNPFKRESLSEYKWRYFICDRIHEAKCTVVPMYFHGENSFWFHFGSWIHVNLRMSMLLRELKNKRNKTLDVTIGDPIPYSTMEGIKDKVELINFIEAQTMRLKDFPPKS